jgi:flavodoxin short chain
MSKAIIIIYDSRTGSTETMARAIEEGMKESGIQVLSKRATKAGAGDLKDVDAVVLGCPTYNGDLMPSMRTFLFEMEKANLKGRVGAAFGSYGWSGEAVQRMADTMKHVFEMNVMEPGLKLLRRPSERDLNECKAFGRKIAGRVMGGVG